MPVDNPSALFLGDRTRHASGSAVTALMEGTRPLLVEIQALAAKAGFGTPQRVATGYDPRRLALLLAVLDKRAGLSFAQLDVFLNVVGGLRMQEPAGDLAVAVALASSVYDRPLPHDAIFLGEVGLAGEIRPVSQVERRLAEADRLGMRTAYLATRSVPRSNGSARERSIARDRRQHDRRIVRAPLPVSGDGGGRRDVGVVIVAAGAGTRAGGTELKQFRWVAGKPMLLHSLQAFQSRNDVAMVVCVLPRSHAGDPPPWIFQCDLDRLLVSVGGRQRGESVANGLEDLPDEVAIVLGARCRAAIGGS